MEKGRTLRVVSMKEWLYYIYNVTSFRLSQGEDYWIINKANGNTVFVNKDMVAIIGYDEDLK